MERYTKNFQKAVKRTIAQAARMVDNRDQLLILSGAVFLAHDMDIITTRQRDRIMKQAENRIPAPVIPRSEVKDNA